MLASSTDISSFPVVMAVDENGGALPVGGGSNERKIVCVEAPTGLP
jgi:hypothetical protein